MRSLLAVRLLRMFGLVLSLAFLILAETAVAADPVEDLVRVLRQSPNPEDKAQVKAYQQRLEKSVEAIKRPSDLRRAMTLPELSGDPQQQGIPPGEEDPAGKIHRTIRDKLTTRLTDALREGLKDNDPGRRLAAITFLALMADHENMEQQSNYWMMRLNPGFPVSPLFTSSLTGELLKVLAEDKDTQVRAAAIGTVAVIAPGAEKTLEALKAALKSEQAVERRAAAEALGKMISTLEQRPGGEPAAVVPGGRQQPPVDAPPRKPKFELEEQTPRQPRPGVPIGGVRGPERPEFGPQRPLSRFDKSRANIVKTAGLGLGDKNDATVRRLCLETIAKAAAEVGNPRGSSPQLAGSVNEQTPAVIGLLADGDVKVCLAAHVVLENVASARRHLHGPEQRPQILDGVLKAVPALTKSLAPEKEVRVRLAALYVLETLDEGAVDAVDTVAEVLRDKKNGYVRWGAARVLKNMAPQAADKAVPALTKALDTEDNKTVRLTIVTGLARYGTKAAAAAEALGKAIADDEPRIRTEAILALAAIGDRARSQEGKLVKAVKEDQTSAVRAAAAETLGRWQPLSAEAQKALRAALQDGDANVRQAASDALLIQPADDMPPP